jgi:hypothetical protein
LLCIGELEGFWLLDNKTVIKGDLFHRAGLQLFAATRWPIRLCVNGNNIVFSSDERGEVLSREAGRPRKADF